MGRLRGWLSPCTLHPQPCGAEAVLARRGTALPCGCLELGGPLWMQPRPRARVPAVLRIPPFHVSQRSPSATLGRRLQPGCGPGRASKPLGLAARRACCWVACPSLEPSAEGALHGAFTAAC